MSYAINHRLELVQAPPIPEAWNWLAYVEHGAAGELLDVCQAVPADPPPMSLRKWVADCAADPETARYTDIFGLDDLRSALAADILDVYGAGPDPSCVMITAGCNQAFVNTMLALAGHGDQIIMPAPWYFNHEMTARMLGVEVSPLPFRPDRRGVPDPEDALQLAGASTRAIVLVSPNNPSGAVYPDDVLNQFFDVARSVGCALVVDETYRDFLPVDARPPHTLFSRRDWADTLVHLYSFSKAYALAGYRVGAAVAGDRFRGEFQKIADCVQICPPHLSQLAALHGVRHLRQWRHDNAQIMIERGKALERAMIRNDLEWELVNYGAYFAYVRHPFRGKASRDVARDLAQDQNVLTLPGSWFGPGQEDYLRFAYANLDGAAMPELARRLSRHQN